MYVDDLLIASKDPTAKKKITDALFAEFAIKREGPLTWYLGIGYDKVAPEDGGGWKLSQKTFIQSLVRKTTTLSPRHTETKTRSRFRTPPPSEGEIEALEKSENVNLQQLIGSLLYVSTNTRPDIALAVSRIARYVTRPTKEIIRAAKHVVKYLHATEDRGLHIRPANGAATEHGTVCRHIMAGRIPETRQPTIRFRLQDGGQPHHMENIVRITRMPVHL